MSDASPAEPPPAPRRSKSASNLALRIASIAGLTHGTKSKRIEAKVQPALFAAAARRVGSTSPAIVIEAALAALATQDDLGPWLAEHWGVLADVDAELLDQIEF